MTVFQALDLLEVMLVTPHCFSDARGYFCETYVKPPYAAHGIAADFVQDNESLSALPGTVRGLHMQAPPFALAKLVRVLSGAVFDVAVDVRKGSLTYGRWAGGRLTAEGGEQLFVPQGFAHGFCTLVPDTRVAYKVTRFTTGRANAGSSGTTRISPSGGASRATPAAPTRTGFCHASRISKARSSIRADEAAAGGGAAEAMVKGTACVYG